MDDRESTHDNFLSAREEAMTKAIEETRKMSAEESTRGRDTKETGVYGDTEVIRRRRPRGKKRAFVADKIAPAVRKLLGHLEVQIIETDCDMEETERAGWADAHCPLLAKAFYVHMSKFAAEALGITMVAAIGEAMQDL